MELRRLRYFEAVADAGSLSGASRTLGIAQPALGRQMQLLEESLGVKLFIRTPKGMLLTDEGRYLKNSLTRPLSELNLALRAVRSHNRSIEASINLGIYAPISRIFGTSLIKKLREDNPNITVRVVEEKASRLRSDLERGAIDVAITYGAPSGVSFELLALTEPLFLLACHDSEGSLLDRVGFDELTRLPLIMDRDPGITLIVLEKLIGRMGGSAIVSLEIDSIPIILEMVRSGFGYSVLTQSDVQFEDMRDIKMIPIDLADATRNVYYAVRQHWHIPMPVYKNFEETLFSVWRKLVDDGHWHAKWIGRGRL